LTDCFSEISIGCQLACEFRNTTQGSEIKGVDLNPVHIRHVREAITTRFKPFLDMSDWATKQQTEQEQAFRSRALTALAVQTETGCTDEEAAATVIDGGDDHGIDAVAVSAPGRTPHLWIIQTKWSDKGSATLNQSEALKLIRGMNKILNTEYDDFNEKFQAMAEPVDAALQNPTIQITIVIALLGGTRIQKDVFNILQEECDKLNFAGPMVDIRILGLKHFHRAILGDSAEPQIKLEVRLEGWNLQKEPYEAYYGSVSAVEVASWYEEHGRALFGKNIRDSLELTDVNTAIAETLRNTPERFWYFNNGITILCGSVGKTPKFAPAPGGPGDFVLEGANVVNGAQTVAAIHRTLQQSAGAPNPARVLVRLISLQNCPEGFGELVTQKTNTQNRVETRDFRALDRDQHSLRQDFTHSLNKRYVIKRGEEEPALENGCTIVEAAVALACAHKSAEYAARAKRDEALLWEDRIYHAIFGVHPNAYRVWRSVLLLRAVRSTLDSLAKDLVGRAAAVASYGDLLITHVVFRSVDTSKIDDQQAPWEVAIDLVPELTKSVLGWLIDSIDHEFGTTSHVIAACRSTERSQTVVDRVLQRMSAGRAAPSLLDSYKASTSGGRRQNAVSILLDADYLPEGTVLTFRPNNKNEDAALAPWLAGDPRRTQATWVKNRRFPLVWSFDERRYSPTGLVLAIYKMATGIMPRAVQGTARWHWGDNGSLVDLAERARQEDDSYREAVADEVLD
jgi:hypothetical protein